MACGIFLRDSKALKDETLPAVICQDVDNLQYVHQVSSGAESDSNVVVVGGGCGFQGDHLLLLLSI